MAKLNLVPMLSEAGGESYSELAIYASEECGVLEGKNFD